MYESWLCVIVTEQYNFIGKMKNDRVSGLFISLPLTSTNSGYSVHTSTFSENDHESNTAWFYGGVSVAA